MHFEVSETNGVTVIQLLDPRLFDTILTAELQDELIELLEHQQPDRVVVDFDSVKHCSTAVINALLTTKKRLVENDGALKLCCMSDSIREAFGMLNLDGTVFDIYESRGDAMDAF